MSSASVRTAYILAATKMLGGTMRILKAPVISSEVGLGETYEDFLEED